MSGETGTRAGGVGRRFDFESVCRQRSSANQHAGLALVAIKNGSAKEVWIDGQLFMTGTGQAALYPDISRLYIGSGIGTLSIDGWIDDFAVYSTPLSGSDVTNLFTGTAPDAISAGPNLIAWWDFNDAPDLSAQVMGDKMVVTFTQVLQSSTNAAGPFMDVPNATSPYTNALSGSPLMFFRTRK